MYGMAGKCAPQLGDGVSLQHTATHCNTLQHTATHCITPCMAWQANARRNLATVFHCDTLQHTATHCNTLQHTASHHVWHGRQMRAAFWRRVDAASYEMPHSHE